MQDEEFLVEPLFYGQKIFIGFLAFACCDSLLNKRHVVIVFFSVAEDNASDEFTCHVK